MHLYIWKFKLKNIKYKDIEKISENKDNFNPFKYGLIYSSIENVNKELLLTKFICIN